MVLYNNNNNICIYTIIVIIIIEYDVDNPFFLCILGNFFDGYYGILLGITRGKTIAGRIPSRVSL